MTQPAGSQLWQDVQIDPVEIALPSGVGLTLRAYRMSTEVEAPEIDRDAELDSDDYDVAAAGVLAQRRAARDDDLDEDDDDEPVAKSRRAKDDDLDDELEELDDEADAEEEGDDTDEDDDEAEKAAEEVPLFLGRRGRVYLFRTAEGLAEFVQSGADNDLAQLPTWPDLVKRIKAKDVAAAEEDSYELDLLVENLRGGPDAWDSSLIIKAGEIARDLGYALRLEPVLTALSAGSPLDDLDETLRAAEGGGPKAFFARRKLRKTAEQQAAIGWRTIISKISAVADWRD